jgi:hypothetical protein
MNNYTRRGYNSRTLKITNFNHTGWAILVYIPIHRPIARHTDTCTFMYTDWDDAAMRMYMRGAIFHEHGDAFLFLNIYIYIYIYTYTYVHNT